MELTKITSSEGKIWDQVWRLYNESFPPHDRRRISSHSLAMEDEQFNGYVALENGNFLGLLFYWVRQDMIYLEHLAVTPSMRSKNVGSAIVKRLMEEHPGKKIVLEIEPPEDELSQRRLKFYQRLGFVVNDFYYEHPSYSRLAQLRHLELLSYPEPLTLAGFEEFLQYMKDRVLKYVD